MRKSVSKYMAEIGRRGGENGKGSTARREAAIKANKARWQGHIKHCEAVKHIPDQSKIVTENKL
jgi:hypothetical protein